MSRFHAYLNTAARITTMYEGAVPLAAWLKNFFREHKQMGSKDRKFIAELVYDFYRLGHSLPAMPVEEKILMALFLCSQGSHPVLESLRPEWNQMVGQPLEEKLQHPDVLAAHFDPKEIFPWKEELSEAIDPSQFALSFLRQPDLFLRLRPGHEGVVRERLTKAGVAYRDLADTCIALVNTTKVDEWVRLDEEAVVQDYSSQRTGDYLPDASLPRVPHVWDCCAASGGKSIMAYDHIPSMRLTVSDVRSSILHNLEARFKRAGIIQYESFTGDLSTPEVKLPARQFDLVLADVPCSGSGTWARTPEQLRFFQKEKILYYRQLQQKIVKTATGRLKKGGRLVYITCSVFREENEDMLLFATSQLGMQVRSAGMLIGYPVKADSMFVSVWEKA